MIGSKLAHYEITGHLGSGGMGDVFQAMDSKLGRSVAIKLLPDAFAGDSDRVARFEREARVLASLNHPNIAAIYGLEQSETQRFLVMEIVDGETLAERIGRAPIPVNEALPIAKQIVEALEAAHDKGIVHRDLKPANIKITSDGKVKVLDFGLAKAYAADAPLADVSNSPTMASMGATHAGIILGTAAYMSPEQAKGRAVDKRTDIFAFGCVLFEMLTKRRAFEGDDVADILSAVLRSEPDWTCLPPDVPPRVAELLRLCLKKEVKSRRQSAGDVRIDIETALSMPQGELPSVPHARRTTIWPVAAALMAVVAAAFAVPAWRHVREISPPEVRLEISTPSTAAPFEFALSPDGQDIVFVAAGDGMQRLWLRPLDKTEAKPLTGTEGANFPFWSPDGRSIGFFATGKLKRVDVAGGPPQTLANAAPGRGGTWNADGVILFAPGVVSSIWKIAATGGDASEVTHLDIARGEAGHKFPHFLPDGSSFLCFVQAATELQGVYIGSLTDGKLKRLTGADSMAAYVSSHILFVRETALMALALDLNRGEASGAPIRVADPIGRGFTGNAGFSTASAGQIAYRAGSSGPRSLVSVDRTGKVAAIVNQESTSWQYPEFSPNAQRIAIQRNTVGLPDIWLIDTLRGGVTRFTFDPSLDNTPVWSPDGARIAFASSRKGGSNLYVKPTNMAAVEELILETPSTKYPRDWSPDGRFLMYTETDPRSAMDLWALPMTGTDKKPFRLVNTPYDELNGQFSADGHWIAYQTNESGRFEIVVQRFPELGGKWQVSTNGGEQPRWRHDGKELYFLAPDGKLMAASITISGTTFSAGTPVALFPARLVTGAGANKQQYDVGRDGRFLLNQVGENVNAAPITVILNWRAP